MNNTRRRTLAIVVLIFTAATLVVGATTTQSASAYPQKKVAHYNNGKHNWKGNSNTDPDTIQKCKQFASGFDPTFGDQNCDILSNSNISEAAAETPPVKLTCEQCFRTILTPQEVDGILIGFGELTLADLCNSLIHQSVSEAFFRSLVADAGISDAKADDLVACLKNAGVAFKNI